ncbi:flavin reductase [Pseudomonas sp. TNT2022 ID233]|uniref:flavin reductase n=1 Tax=Pseudomonas aphyarum TaxID=2942629 RepID=UPI00235F7653|nr:flavin reductase [Pseudomonas aphyarum]MDD1139207.1 flavin reductase [Pseudomonas aphyarum]
MVDSTEFRNAMAMLGSAVTIVTTDGPAGRFGFTASAVCSVTDSPPTLLVCVNRSSSNHEHFKTNGVLCVNVLTGDHQSTSGAFANRQLSMQERFSGVNCQTLKTGSPVIEEALVSLDCRVSKVDEVGTHSIFYCEILELQQHSEATEGLVYFNRSYYRLNDELRLAPEQ